MGKDAFQLTKILKNNVLELNLLISLWLRWRVAETGEWKTQFSEGSRNGRKKKSERRRTLRYY